MRATNLNPPPEIEMSSDGGHSDNSDFDDEDSTSSTTRAGTVTSSSVRHRESYLNPKYSGPGYSSTIGSSNNSQ